MGGLLDPTSPNFVKKISSGSVEKDKESLSERTFLAYSSDSPNPILLFSQ
jgi:hypothetical protein